MDGTRRSARRASWAIRPAGSVIAGLSSWPSCCRCDLDPSSPVIGSRDTPAGAEACSSSELSSKPSALCSAKNFSSAEGWATGRTATARVAAPCAGATVAMARATGRGCAVRRCCCCCCCCLRVRSATSMLSAASRSRRCVSACSSADALSRCATAAAARASSRWASASFKCSSVPCRRLFSAVSSFSAASLAADTARSSASCWRRRLSVSAAWAIASACFARSAAFFTASAASSWCVDWA